MVVGFLEAEAALGRNPPVGSADSHLSQGGLLVTAFFSLLRQRRWQPKGLTED